MSATEFYLNKGHTPVTKTVVISGADTVSVWAGVAGKRPVVTSVNISANYAGTVAFYFDQGAASKIAEYLVAASATISPVIGAWEQTIVAGAIRVRKGPGTGTDDLRVNLTGFELG